MPKKKKTKAVEEVIVEETTEEVVEETTTEEVETTTEAKAEVVEVKTYIAADFVKISGTTYKKGDVVNFDEETIKKLGDIVTKCDPKQKCLGGSNECKACK